jgi:ABC-2 type transport system ATP-binding protein
MNTAVPALALEDLGKRFGPIHAVQDLSLEVQPGQMAGFLGPNGAGKSTTLYMIPRLVRPTTGHIRVFGIDVWQDFRTAIRSVGIMVETPAFYEFLSARKNLELAARLHGPVQAHEIDSILERMGLADRQHSKVRTYSMGMKQRLGIGRALLGHPQLLILDEPTNGMDPEGTREILTFLRQQVETQGLTVFVSSHLLHEVEAYCDSVFVINKGTLVASGNVRDILKPHDSIVKVEFAKAPTDIDIVARDKRVAQVEETGPWSYEITLREADSTWLNIFLLSHGFKVREIAAKPKSLKEFFLSITGDQADATDIGSK